MNNNIKNIVFDLGQVIVKFNYEDFVNDYNISEEDKELLRKTFFHVDAFLSLDDGYITIQDYYDMHYKELPERLWDTAHDAYVHYPEKRVFIDGMIDLIKQLKNKYNIYILSNNNMESYEYLMTTELKDLINGWIISAKYHVVKPHDEIYQHLFKEFNLNPSECIFIDDRQDNIDAGKNNGMDGIVFTDCSNLVNQLKEKGIEIN